MADMFTALQFLVDQWPLLAIGAFIGVLFSWSRWVPSKWAQIKSAVFRRSYGVVKIRLKSKKFHNEVADFGLMVHRSKKGYGAFNHTKCIIGFEDGVPIAAVTQSDPDAVPLFRNDYKSSELINPSTFDDALEWQFQMGKISEKKEDKRMFYLAIITLVAVVGVGFLVFSQGDRLTAIGNGINQVAGSLVAGKQNIAILPGKG